MQYTSIKSFSRRNMGIGILILVSFFETEGKDYVISHTHGTVRSYTTEIVSEESSSSAELALYASLQKNREDSKILLQTWEIVSQSVSEKYACLENPASFVSDIIDCYEAKEGRLQRNSKGQLHFLVSRYYRGKVVEEVAYWGESAETVIAQYLKETKRAWECTSKNTFSAFAEKTFVPHEPSEWVGATIYLVDQ